MIEFSTIKFFLSLCNKLKDSTLIKHFSRSLFTEFVPENSKRKICNIVEEYDFLKDYK